MDNWCSYFQTLYINETHKHIPKTEFVTSFFDVSMSDFDLYILKKYLFIPLLVLCPTLQCFELVFTKTRVYKFGHRGDLNTPHPTSVFTGCQRYFRNTFKASPSHWKIIFLLFISCSTVSALCRSGNKNKQKLSAKDEWTRSYESYDSLQCPNL